MLDGENIPGWIETPLSLRLEDGDQIDAILVTVRLLRLANWRVVCAVP